MATEKRLIDANRIPYHKSGFPKGDGFDSRLDWAFREDIDKQPTVDAVEVVRCRDCQHYMTIHCTCDGCCISDDWYCADGERKGDG